MNEEANNNAIIIDDLVKKYAPFSPNIDDQQIRDIITGLVERNVSEINNIQTNNNLQTITPAIIRAARSNLNTNANIEEVMNRDFTYYFICLTDLMTLLTITDDYYYYTTLILSIIYEKYIYIDSNIRLTNSETTYNYLQNIIKFSIESRLVAYTEDGKLKYYYNLAQNTIGRSSKTITLDSQNNIIFIFYSLNKASISNFINHFSIRHLNESNIKGNIIPLIQAYIDRTANVIFTHKPSTTNVKTATEAEANMETT